MSLKLDELKDDFKMVVDRERQSRDLELVLWCCASIGILGGGLIDLVSGKSFVVVMTERYSEIIIALAVLVFPALFKLIFSAFPFETIRHNRSLKGNPNYLKSSTFALRMKKAEASVLAGVNESVDLKNFSASELFSQYALSSRKLSQNLYSRSGVYLLVGVAVAFSGLVFFYIETLTNSTAVGMQLVIILAPKFGILFFIELVAFFFLRQYRSAMDEFRYYEAVKRKREEILALIQLTFESGKGAEVLELVRNGCFFSEGKVLGKDQTTEIIESRKLERNELEILEKVIDVVSRSKS